MATATAARDKMLRMRPRNDFKPGKYLEHIKQVQSNNENSTTISRRNGSDMPLSDAVEIVYGHLAERSKKDKGLHEDILNAGLGEPTSQSRMKAIIENLLMEYRIEIDRTTLIDNMSPNESVFALTCGAGLIEDLRNEVDVEEVQIIGREIFLIKNAVTYKHHRTFASERDVHLLQDRLALCGKKPINDRHPVLQTYLWNRSRLLMTRAPYSDVPSIHLRNFIVKDVDLDKVQELGTINGRMNRLLKLFVLYMISIFIGGATNTGKTTLLYGLLNETEDTKRIRSLESEFEISLRERLKGGRSVLALRAVPDLGITMEEGYKPIMLMSPEWIALGESKGAELAQAVQGALRGHSVMTTGHIKFLESYLSDCVDMLKQDNRQHSHEDLVERIARAFNVVILLDVVKIKGVNFRVVSEITAMSVDSKKNVHIDPLVKWNYINQDWEFTGNKISEGVMNYMVGKGANIEDFKELGVF